MLFTAMSTGVEFLTDVPMPGPTPDSTRSGTRRTPGTFPGCPSDALAGNSTGETSPLAPRGPLRRLLTVTGCWMLVVLAYLLCLVIPVLAMVLTIIEAFREQHWVIGSFCTGMLILVVVSLFLPEGAERSPEGLDSTGRPVPSEEDPGYHVTP